MTNNSMFMLVAIAWLCGCTMTTTEKVTTRHIFYLHGRIIEDQGRNAFSEEFGKYELDSIAAALQRPGSRVYSEIRQAHTDPLVYARRVSHKIDSLVENGVAPRSITVVGASKGAVIASNISSQNHYAINYVLLGGNNIDIEQHNDWIFTGRVLAIYDTSDLVAGKDYSHWIGVSNAIEFQQLEIDTGLGHGFLYKPLETWLGPTRQWIENQTIE